MRLTGGGVLLGLVWGVSGCSGADSGGPTPSPGPVNSGTIEEVMTEDVFGERLENGDIYLLEPFQQVPPATGQICLAIGVLEPTGQSPAGLYQYDADLLPVYTAEVSYDSGEDLYFGSYFEYDISTDPGYWVYAGDYEYRPNVDGVEVYSLVPMYTTMQSYYELNTGDMELNLTGLEPCRPF